MKKGWATLLIISMITMAFCSCDFFGEKHITDVGKYGDVESYIDFPKFFPETVEDYGVNSYSYTLYSYFDTCYEIYLDITVTEKQLIELISKVRAYSTSAVEKDAYYAEGYYEIVFTDEYTINAEAERANVWNAKIEKVIYNPVTFNIVFESFDAFDSGVYPLNEVAYFNRFGIDQVEYERFVNGVVKRQSL